ncbi:MAG: ArsR family transcriptional regulator [Alphaproteobacteria bacterium]|nr:ArsR family transcriptional regulator [Alphaproteobacteria bacterium]
MESAKSRLLDLVKRDGPLSADALAESLGVTPMAVRQHLYALAEDGLVAETAAPRAAGAGRGRPVKLWQTTGKAAAHFPDSHSALAAELLGQMKKAFGDEGVDKLLKLRTADQEQAYRTAMDGKKTLKARLDALAKIREREGYMAAVKKDGEAYVLVENHCPVCVAARVCQGLCREELSLFQRILGKDAKVERTSHILAGASRCAYRITPA